MATAQKASYNLIFWTGGYELLVVQGRSVERTRDDMYNEGCGMEENYGHEGIRKNLYSAYKEFTPQTRKAFAGFLLSANGGATELSYVLAKETKNNLRLTEVIKDTSKFFAPKYKKEADIIIKEIEKKLRHPGPFSFFIHSALCDNREKSASYGFKYECKYGEDVLTYAKTNLKKQTAVKDPHKNPVK